MRIRLTQTQRRRFRAVRRDAIRKFHQDIREGVAPDMAADRAMDDAQAALEDSGLFEDRPILALLLEILLDFLLRFVLSE